MLVAAIYRVIVFHFTAKYTCNKIGLQPVSRPVEQVSLLRWLGMGALESVPCDSQSRTKHKEAWWAPI